MESYKVAAMMHKILISGCLLNMESVLENLEQPWLS